jgi:hypothetical protein
MRLILVFLLLAAPLAAQLPAGQPKPRLELADTARREPSRPRAMPPSAPLARDTGVTAVKKLLRSSFVRRQAVLGLVLYGPSFAATVANKPVPATAAYLVMAGGSFFAAAEIARDLPITEGMEMLATVAPIQGAAIGAALQYAATGSKKVAPGIFFGSLLGTTGALTLGRRLTTGAAVASLFGADAAAGLAMGTLYAFDDHYAGDRTRAAVGAGAAIAGLQLGAMYATYAPYNVTAGDVQTLWITALIGAAGASAFVANGHPGHKTSTLTALGGAVAGLAAGDRLLVRRFDHTRGEAALVGTGSLAGALMGGGVAVLVGASARFNAATAALGATGAAGGVWMAERWLGSRPDAGHRVSERLTLTPQGLAMAAARVPGTYSIVTLTF